jgi:hypothetical protein
MKDFWMRGSDGCEKETSEAPLVSVVDDDASVRRSTRRLLRCSALRAEAFASSEEFLQSGRMAETACLLLDVSMPGIVSGGEDGMQSGRLTMDRVSFLAPGWKCGENAELKIWIRRPGPRGTGLYG